MALNCEIVNESKLLSVEVQTDASEEDVKHKEDLKCCEEILKNTNGLQLQIDELCTKVNDLQVENQPVIKQYQEQLQLLQDFCHEMSKQIASIEAIQNVQSEEFQLKVLEKDQMREQLLLDLKRQEESHLQEVQQLRSELNIQLEEKDKQCLQLEQEIFRCKDQENISISCSICMEPWGSSADHRLVALNCGHLFGEKCIRYYLQHQHSECPQCRAYASSQDMRYIYGRP